MHWVIQKSLFKPINHQRLTEALVRLGIEYTDVNIPRGTFDLEPEVSAEGKVYVCGALKLRKIAKDRGWDPGSFLNDEFSVEKWVSELGDVMLNHDVIHGTLRDVVVGASSHFFIRPLEDNKAFDGMVIDSATLNAWREDEGKERLQSMKVAVSSVKEIRREYRLFVVQNRVVTGSVYKIAGEARASQDVEDEVTSFVQEVVAKWTPCESVVVDVCLTDEGYKVIEFNNINSSGFYASDVERYVAAIQNAYA